MSIKFCGSVQISDIPRPIAKARGRVIDNAKSFRCSSTTKEDECDNDEQRNQDQTRVHHIAPKRRHFDTLCFRDAFHHEVGSVSDVGIGSHKDRSTGDGRE